MPFGPSPSSARGVGSAVPPEPPLPPRPFRWRALDAGTTFLLLFGAIWTLVGGGVTTVFTIAGGPLWNDLILDRRAEHAEAMPTSVDGTGSSVNGRRVFRVSYSFFDQAGQPQESHADTTDAMLLARAQRRERLPIDYDPRAPALSRLTGGQASFFGWFTLLPLGFAVAGLLILRAGLRRVVRTRAIYVHGQSALARVTDISSTNMRVNRRPVMRVGYEFDTIMGKATGTTTSLHPPSIGAELWVFYRSGDPKQSVAAR
jgi:hypothetical protein